MGTNPLPWFHSLAASGDPGRDVCRFLRASGRTGTLRHVVRVAAAGRQLARRRGLDLARARLACLAHDLAAVVPPRDILAAAAALGLRLTEADRAIPQVVHGPVGAEVLKLRLGVEDEGVLAAVRHHSTLRAGASDLERLTFIADKIALDPTAQNASFQPDLLAAVRAGAPLTRLCFIYLDWAVRCGPGLGWRLHPNLLAAHAELEASLAKAKE